MPKNIVVFSDGTGNSAAKVFKTNVWRTYQALDLSSADQIAEYDDGVGTSSFRPFAMLGGALGVGLARNVQGLYAFICRNYVPGDRIYAFGFSRGAFTIRILTQLIMDQGILPPMAESERQRLVRSAYREFRKQFDLPWSLVPTLRRIRDGMVRAYERLFGLRSYSDVTATRSEELAKPSIEFVGLWDTVDAYGLPIEEMTRAWDLWIWPLSMRTRVLHERVKRARHALALDDERNTFHPLLWDESKEPPGANHIDEERLVQVWFSGMHANVGGGYADDSMSSVTLDWMLREAAKSGLKVTSAAAQAISAQAQAALKLKAPALATARGEVTSFGRIYDSRHGFGSYYRYQPRKLELLTQDPTAGVRIDTPKIHASVFERIGNGGDHYAPVVLPKHYAVVDEAGNIHQLASQGAATGARESASQASARGRDQEIVWNFVWGRRVVYFANVILSAFFVLLPWRLPSYPDGSCSGPLCFLSPVIGAAAMVLPAFVQPWFEGYRSNPQYLLTAIVVLGGLTMAANALRVRTDDRMRAQWAHLHNGGDAPATWSRTHGIIHATRTASWYRSFFRFLKRHLLPDAIGIAFFVAGFLILSRVVVAIASSLGGACTPAATPAAFDAKGIARPAAEFTTSDRCWGSGVALAEGARYRLELVRGTEWKDGDGGDAAIGMRGDEARGLRGHVLLPFRRQLGRSWFQPIARIGVDGEDEYPLDPVVGVAAAENPNRIVTELTARTSGELFLYVNDGVLLWPSLWKVFYANNQGSAAITVQRLPQPDIPE